MSAQMEECREEEEIAFREEEERERRAEDAFLALQQAAKDRDPFDGLDAVIEGVAVEEMAAWKAARFQHADRFARRIGERVLEIMREGEDAAPSRPEASEGETKP